MPVAVGGGYHWHLLARLGQQRSEPAVQGSDAGVEFICPWHLLSRHTSGSSWLVLLLLLHSSSWLILLLLVLLVRWLLELLRQWRLLVLLLRRLLVLLLLVLLDCRTSISSDLTGRDASCSKHTSPVAAVRSIASHSLC
jgi:hypothetical protein